MSSILDNTILVYCYLYCSDSSLILWKYFSKMNCKLDMFCCVGQPALSIQRKARFDVFLCVLQELRDKGTEVWKISKVQFVYDTSETSHFINAYNRESPAKPLYSSYSAHFHPANLLSFISHLYSAGIRRLIHAGISYFRPRIWNIWVFVNA